MWPVVPVMQTAGDGPHGRRLRALIVALWRAGLRMRRSLSPNRTSTTVAARCSSVAATAAGAGTSVWTSALGSNSSHGIPSASSFLAARCSASSTARRAGGRGRPPPSAHRTATHGSCRGRPAALRAASAPPRARRAPMSSVNASLRLRPGSPAPLIAPSSSPSRTRPGTVRQMGGAVQQTWPVWTN